MLRGFTLFRRQPIGACLRPGTEHSAKLPAVIYDFDRFDLSKGALRSPAMKAELTARLRQQIRLELELGRRSLDELAIASDLSVTTLRRFLDDGELSMPAAMRVAHAMGLAQRLKLAENELAESFADSGEAILG